MNHPLILLVMTFAGLYVGKLWYDDLRAARHGRPHPGALPGATPTSHRTVVTAVGGAIILLAAETLGEQWLGIADQQSRMTWLFAVYSIVAAPVIEELIFRGWLIRLRGTPAQTWAVALLASTGFALLHPFLWRWDDAGFATTLTAKGAFSSAIVFATSLWLYAVRLARWNPTHSLLPCFAAHAARNAGVVAIKAATGFMAGAW